MKKKVAFLLKNLDGGGAERVASNITLNLSNEKYEKYIILDNEEIICYDYDAKLLTLGVKDLKSILGRIKNFIIKINRTRKIKKQYDFDVIISFLSGSNLINIITKQNEKNIISVRNYMSREHTNFRGKILNLLSKNYYNKADLVTVVSEESKLDLMDNFNVDSEKIRVIYNPYDLNKLEKLSSECIDKQYENIFEKPVIINIGRLSEQKGHKYLIEIFKDVKKVCDANLVLLGKGELEEELRLKAKKYGLEDSIHFLGFQSNPYKFIAKSKIMLMTSLYEGFPNVMLEAMGCGIPIISTDCKSGPREILIKNYNLNENLNYNKLMDYGFLIPDICGCNIENDKFKNIKGIAIKHIIQILNDEELYEKLKEKSFSRSRDFRIEKIIKYWEDIIDYK